MKVGHPSRARMPNRQAHPAAHPSAARGPFNRPRQSMVALAARASRDFFLPPKSIQHDR